MELSAPRALSVRRSLPAPDTGRWATFGLGAVLVAYLGLSGGGYALPVYGQVGIALSWLCAIGLLAGVLPAGRRPRLAWAALGVLAAFAAWTAIGLTWTESGERTSVELARVLTYLAAFATAVLALRAGRGGALLDGVATGGAVVAGVALASRLHPEWVGGAPELATFLTGSASRLSYPLNYWNGLGALCALLLPLLLGNAVRARTVAGRALACGAVPAMALCLYLTGSRGGLLAACAALAVLVLLAPNRLALLGPLALGAGGAALAILAAAQRDAVLETTVGPAGAAARGEMLAVLAVVCGGVLLLRVSLDHLAQLIDRPRALSPGRGRTAALAAACAAAAAVVAVAAGAPGAVADRWNEFKDASPLPGTVQLRSGNDLFDRLQNSSGLGRYDYWVSAARAAETQPARGRGPGTFGLWWSRERTQDGGYVRNAHSLYLETLAETGYTGLLLLLGFFAVVLAAAVRRSLRAPAAARWPAAIAGAGVAAFMVSAAFDWVWQLPVVAAAMLMLAAVVVCEGSPRAAGHRPFALRAAGAVVALVAAGFLALNVGGQGLVRESQAAAGAPDLVEAARKARQGADVQPYAASAHLQLSLVLEAAGAPGPALDEARRAAEAEPTDWRPWLSVARLEAANGSAGAAVRAYRRARSLNPTSAMFKKGSGGG